MEFFTTLIFCVIVTALIWFLVYTYKLATYWEKRGVPHGSDIPYLSGLVPMLFRTQRVDEIVTKTYERFPNARYYGTLVSHLRTIIVRDPELINEICVKNFDCFTDHLGFVSTDLDPIFGRNVFSLRGHKWRDMRGTLSPSFTASKMKFMFELVSQCAHGFADFFLKHPDAAKCVDMKDAFSRYTNDVIATAAFGISVNSLEDRNNEFYERGRDATNFNGVVRSVRFIFNILAPKLMKLLGFSFMTKKTDLFFKQLISETVKTREEQGIVRPDMIHLLMQAKDKDGEKLSITDIMAQAFIFFIAGFETTANHMCTVAHELAMNADIQERLRQEVKENATRNGGVISYETLSQMKYMDMVLKETLRKYPPLLSTDRLCTKKFQLPPAMPGFSECQLEVGNSINIPIYGIHHDPNYYPDPEKFDPERFNDENKDSIDACAYLPFGIGPRQCIANRFALMETKILFAHILLNFVVKPTTKTRHPFVFGRGITMCAEDGFWNEFEEIKK